MYALPLLSLAIWIPISFGVLVLATGSDRNAPLARIIALVGAVLGFVVTLPIYAGFSPAMGGFQYVQNVEWIEAFNVNYHLGIDGVSLLLLLLNSFTTVIVVIAGWEIIQKRVAQYMASFLILSGLMNGVFCALDALLFYVFFEATLIPMFIIIGIWGGPNRVYASIKFFLYTLLGSLLSLVALIYLYFASGQQLFAARFLRYAARDECADIDFPGVLHGVCGQGADVAGAYLAAGCPRRSAHRRLGGAGGDHAEARRLRFPAAVTADRAGCQPRAGGLHDLPVADGRGVHRAGGAGADRHEKADRLFIDLAHGLCHAGPVHLQSAGHGRRA